MRPGSVAEGASAMVWTSWPVASSKIRQPGRPLMRAGSRRQARLVGRLLTPAPAGRTKTTRYVGGLSFNVVHDYSYDGAMRSHEQSLHRLGLPKVDINGTKASELRTALGTVLSFERSGVRYLVGGAVAPGAVEEIARGL